MLDRDTPIARLLPLGTEAFVGAAVPRTAPPTQVAPPARARRRCRGPAAGGTAGKSVIAYLDASVLLRVVLGQRHRLAEWKDVRVDVASALTEVECLRTLDRLRVQGAAAEQIAVRRETVHRLMERIEVVEPTSVVLSRAAQPMPIPLGHAGRGPPGDGPAVEGDTTMTSCSTPTIARWHSRRGRVGCT